MTILVGYSPQESGAAALDLGAVLARSLGERLVVATAVAMPQPLFETTIDNEYRAYMRQWGERALEHARQSAPGDVQATYVLVESSSIVAALREAADRHDASMIVLGSSAHGLLGRISLGSVIESLAHGSPKPLALAPRGYRAGPQDRVEHLSVLFSDAESIAAMHGPAHEYADRMSVPVRFTSFIVRPIRRDYGVGVPAPDDGVVDAWVERMRTELSSLAQQTLGAEELQDRLVIGEGLTWAHAAGAIPWRHGDLVLVGPASSGPLSRVHLGSRASKIVRAVPVPVVLLPKGDAEATPGSPAAGHFQVP